MPTARERLKTEYPDYTVETTVRDIPTNPEFELILSVVLDENGEEMSSHFERFEKSLGDEALRIYKIQTEEIASEKVFDEIIFW